MFISIDDRAGSKDLARFFNDGDYELVRLDFGDVAFIGNGPQGPAVIGIEYKQISDAIQCLKDGRFTGHQLPGMLQIYDYSYLLIQGQWKIHKESGKLITPRKGGNTIHYGIPHRAFDNWLTTLSTLVGVGIKTTQTPGETGMAIHNLYNWWQKPWEEHSSHISPHIGRARRPVISNGDTLPHWPTLGDDDFPEYVLRLTLYNIPGVGWDRAGIIAAHYKTVDAILHEPQKGIQGLEGVGKTLADRIYTCLHGHSDPDASKKKAKNAT